MPDVKSCETCRFYQPSVCEDDGGECHRCAPSAHSVVSGENFDKVAFWPWVSQDDWCGEWRRKEWWE
jgi:hypothetical protein